MAKKSQPSISQSEKSPHGSTAKHEALVTQILLTVSATQLARVWPNKTGAAFRNGRMISYGLKGSADILGLLNDGTFLAIECKTGRAKQSKGQVNFEKMVKQFNGIYIVARSIGDVMIVLNQWQRESRP